MADRTSTDNISDVLNSRFPIEQTLKAAGALIMPSPQLGHDARKAIEKVYSEVGHPASVGEMLAAEYRNGMMSPMTTPKILETMEHSQLAPKTPNVKQR